MTVTGADGNARRVTGGSIDLPPGTYTVEVRAPGHRPASSEVTVRAGAGQTWSPQLEAMPADPPATPPPAPDAPSAEEQVRGVLGAFVTALESRDLDAVASRYPGAGGAWREQWRPFFENTRDVRDLSIQLVEIARMTVESDVARATFAVQMSYDDFRNRRQQPTFEFEATLRSTPQGWSLAELRQIQ